jgi:hypothetical protein
MLTKADACGRVALVVLAFGMIGGRLHGREEENLLDVVRI